MVYGSVGYRATMTASSINDGDNESTATTGSDDRKDKKILRIQERVNWHGCFWNPTFELYNDNDKHYATVVESAEDSSFCAPDYYEVIKVNSSKSCSDESDNDEDDEAPGIWMTVHEDTDDDYWSTQDPEFIFRRSCMDNTNNDKRSKRKKKSGREKVAKLCTDFTTCAAHHQLHINRDTTKEERHTIIAVGLIIMKLKEKKRQSESSGAAAV